MMKAVIFDMDGVLIDSEPLHTLADNQILIDSGITAPATYFERFVGWTNQSMWEEIKKDYHITASAEELMELQMPLKIKLLQVGDYVPIPGIVDLLEQITGMNIPIAIASSSPLQFIEAVLEKLGLKNYVKLWLSGEEVERSKPEPDIFLKVAELLNVNPNDCIVIEDSSSGVSAAKKAGMRCIGFRNINSGNQNLSGADLIVNKIDEINIKEVISLTVRSH
jgi:HAD superfamily hydrolase (TIGR01509 family)